MVETDLPPQHLHCPSHPASLSLTSPTPLFSHPAHLPPLPCFSAQGSRHQQPVDPQAVLSITNDKAVPSTVLVSLVDGHYTDLFSWTVMSLNLCLFKWQMGFRTELCPGEWAFL